MELAVTVSVRHDVFTPFDTSKLKVRTSLFTRRDRKLSREPRSTLGVSSICPSSVAALAIFVLATASLIWH